jgi:hypothetical protein
MPLARYFLYVGAVLLALLLVAEAYLPKLPATERAHANLPLIRIHSDRKWPQRIVYDTGLPAGISSAVAALEPDVQSGAMSESVSLGPKEREAFAQIRSSDAEQSQRTVSRPQEHARQSRRKYARKGMSKLAMARPSQFGWFGKSFW